MPRLLILPLLAMMSFTFHAQAHEVSADGLRIAHPFASPTPPGAPNGAAYLDISADDASLTLVGASSPVSDVVEIHTMSMEDGTMRMRRLEELAVPAGETIKMRPGDGVHLMLIGLQDKLEAGDKFPMTLEFAELDSLEVEVWVQEPAQGSAAADDHHHH